MWIVLATVLIGAVAKHQDVGSDVEFVALSTLCSRSRALSSLGMCSSYFIECSGNNAIVKKCPFQSQVFHEGRCVQAKSVSQCYHSEWNLRHAETKLLAQDRAMCSSASLLISSSRCSSQALVCHTNTRDIIVASCPQGYVLDQNLQCKEAARECDYASHRMLFPIRQHILNEFCEEDSVAVKYGLAVTDTCKNWFVTCAREAQFVQCDAGSVFDEKQGGCVAEEIASCRQQMSCYGREWQRVSVGKCSNEFVYCEGATAVWMRCHVGTVFQNGRCVSPQKAQCAECNEGDTKAAENCNEYFVCAEEDNGLTWQSMTCDDGHAFNHFTRKCVRDYTCATSSQCEAGSSFAISCGIYMYCSGSNYERFQCPPRSRWDEEASRCVQDPECADPTRKVECRNGDELTSEDCDTFTRCVKGKFVSVPCRSEGAYYEASCNHCSSSETSESYLQYPGECEDGETRPHEEDCQAYFACEQQRWVYHRCRTGSSFNDGSCQAGSYACSAASQVQCNEHEVIARGGEHCEQFLECRNRRWHLMICPPGTIFDVRCSSCVRGTCAGDAPTEQLPTVPNPQPYPNDQLPPIDPTFASPSCSEGFRVGDQFDCSRFWQCKPNGFYSNRGCREGFHFDVNTKECVQGSCTLDEACKKGAFQPLEICGQYKTCYGGRWITAQCMHNSRFFDGKCSQESCDDRHYDEGNVAARECVTGTVSPGSSNDRYLMCYYGRWTERHCPPGHVFDWKTLRCHTNVPEPEYRPDCYDGWTKPSGRCGHYEVCEYGKWIPKTCPYGQRFVNGYCIDGTCEETSGFCRESGGPDGYRAVRYDCTKYFQCVHGSWMERPCAPATAWNAALTTCDHIGNVPTCGAY